MIEEPTMPTVEAPPPTEQGLEGGRRPSACSLALGTADIKRLGVIAQLIDSEAECWQQGFAARYKDRWEWDGEYPEIHARFIRLQSAASFLRRTQCRLMKQANS